MKKNWRVESREIGYAIYDGTDCIPGIFDLSDEDVEQYEAVKAQWDNWQSRLENIYRAQAASDDAYRAQQKELAELARLKQKYES